MFSYEAHLDVLLNTFSSDDPQFSYDGVNSSLEKFLIIIIVILFSFFTLDKNRSLGFVLLEKPSVYTFASDVLVFCLLKIYA